MTDAVRTPLSPAALRLVDALEAYAGTWHTLRFSPLGGKGLFWHDLPLTLPQMRALGIIACAARVGASGRDLATQLGVGPSAVTPLVDRLVEHGYVIRQEDPVDRRIQRMRITDKGVEVLRHFSSVRREALAEIVTHIDPNDMPIVEQALQIMTDAVRRLAAERELSPS